MRLITTSDDLKAFADELADRPFVAVDTEFMREKTFWPILCLIQAAADGVEAIIDPLADGLDLGVFLKTLSNPGLVKVFHAARQDIEIFYRLTGEIPAPLFDTQIAAMACGFGDQIGYEPLMRTLVGARIDKGSRFTDWSRRPLTDAQLTYALSDVTHLRAAYPHLRDRLEKQSRLHWVESEMDSLNNPELYYVDPKTAWKRLKLKGVKTKDLGALIKLAEWREREAQMRDVPRSRILKDDTLFELARLQPKTKADMARARGVPTGFERSSAAGAILAAIAAGAEMPQKALPEISRPERHKPPADVVELLKVLLKRQCDRFHVAPKLIATSADLEEIARNDNADIPALKGWRREVFGEAALKLKRGELALKLKDGAVEFVET